MHILFEYRREHGLTQEELADLLGVTQGLVGHIERGIRTPSPKLAKKIEEKIGISRHKLRPDIFSITAV